VEVQGCEGVRGGSVVGVWGGLVWRWVCGGGSRGNENRSWRGASLCRGKGGWGEGGKVRGSLMVRGVGHQSWRVFLPSPLLPRRVFRSAWVDCTCCIMVN